MKDKAKSESPLIGEQKQFTIQQCKEKIAKLYGFDNWDRIDFYMLDSQDQTAQRPYAEERLNDEVAELYASQFKTKEESLPEATEIDFDGPMAMIVHYQRLSRYWENEAAKWENKFRAKEDNKAFGEQEELWAKVIFEARHYNGTPHDLRALTEHFKKLYRIEKQTI